MSRQYEPHIEIRHSDDSIREVAGSYDCDKGPLAMPDHIRIGQFTWDDRKITSYSEQVDEYGVWLEDQLKNQNQEIMVALEEIYQRATGHGVILVTRCCPTPYITHAHAVRRVIMELAQ